MVCVKPAPIQFPQRQRAARAPVAVGEGMDGLEAMMQDSTILCILLGEGGVFAYPKSLYAVRDSLRIVSSNNPNAVILDFFAGSGTTFHATVLLNH